MIHAERKPVKMIWSQKLMKNVNKCLQIACRKEKAASINLPDVIAI